LVSTAIVLAHILGLFQTHKKPIKQNASDCKSQALLSNAHKKIQLPNKLEQNTIKHKRQTKDNMKNLFVYVFILIIVLVISIAGKYKYVLYSNITCVLVFS